MAYFYNDFPPQDKIKFIKGELIKIVKSIFDNPASLKDFIDNNTLSNDQSKLILKVVDTFNSKPCSCCRKFDLNKVKLTPINIALEPLLDIAQNTARNRSY